MTDLADPAVTRRAGSFIARRRGALIGFTLIVLGAWGALIPFVGPYFDYAYTPDSSWAWTASRGWLEVTPGAVAAAGGLLLLVSNRRAVALLGAWMAMLSGMWFVLGPTFAETFHTGAVGTPAGSPPWLRVVEALGFFYALGVVIVFLAATASGRLSVRSMADIRFAQRQIDREAAARSYAMSSTKDSHWRLPHRAGHLAPEDQPATAADTTTGDQTREPAHAGHWYSHRRTG